MKTEQPPSPAMQALSGIATLRSWTPEQPDPRHDPGAMTAAVLVAAERIAVVTPRGERLLDDVSFTVRAGELVVVVGPSGAGKTTLLRALAGLRRASDGRVLRAASSGSVGYVPQDDIVHAELTVAECVRYAARLRHGRQLTGPALDQVVAATLAEVGLSDRADVPVGLVSGGQRKRVSIATELVARPSVCVLDEPTSGLDPHAAADLMGTLASLAGHGTAVVMSTHNLADLTVAHRVVVVARGGRVDYDGPPEGAPVAYRTVGHPADLRRPRPIPQVPPPVRPAAVDRRTKIAVLTRRNLTVSVRNRTSAAIMAGSPFAVVAMMAVLFRSSAAGPGAASAEVAGAFAYWLAFAGFFFGLTFGLLQICGELPIARRELDGPVDPESYLAAKIALLVPVLAVVDAVMVAVLVAIGRIDGSGAGDLTRLWGLLVLGSLAGLAIGLLASAAVTGPVQATLALPMLCFPAVLFGGAIVPVADMTALGRGLADTTSTRWSFDAISALLVPGAHHAAGALPVLAAMCVLATVAARVVLVLRTRVR